VPILRGRGFHFVTLSELFETQLPASWCDINVVHCVWPESMAWFSACELFPCILLVLWYLIQSYYAHVTLLILCVACSRVTCTKYCIVHAVRIVDVHTMSESAIVVIIVEHIVKLTVIVIVMAIVMEVNNTQYPVCIDLVVQCSMARCA
jgi:hypothetical protein